VPAARRIAVSQTVDQANLRMPAQNALDVDGVNSIGHARRNHFQSAEQPFDDSGLDRLRRRNDDILTARAAPPALVKHAKRFADAARISQENFQTPLRGAALLRLHLLQKLLWTGPAVFGFCHEAAGVNYPPTCSWDSFGQAPSSGAAH
jgi:hypothetical protein